MDTTILVQTDSPSLAAWNDEFDPDWFQMPLILRVTLNSAWRAGRRTSIGPCLFFNQKTKRCRQYDHRPSACRRFEPGNFHCMEYLKLLAIQ
jgi:Fe-S-cluster containining protein